MKDRISTKIIEVAPGKFARRYADYSEAGVFLGYRWMALADEPMVTGTPIAKATMLDDATETALWGDTADRTVNQAFGQLKNIADGLTRMETGTYLGTGTYGASARNSLSFSFMPIVVGVTGGGSLYLGNIIIREQLGSSGIGALSASGNSLAWVISWDEKSVTWHSAASSSSSPDEKQLNRNGTTYYYFALG